MVFLIGIVLSINYVLDEDVVGREKHWVGKLVLGPR